jgi:cardiolipin hydrolase
LQAAQIPPAFWMRSGAIKIGFSPGKDCKNLIINHLTGAKKSLDICVFTISDNDIADCIIRRHQAGLAIRLIGDNEKAEDDGSDMRRMAEAGIPVKIDYSPNHMHHKFSIVDEEELLTGSYNWTRSAEQYNQENLIVWRNPGLALSFKKEFDRLWSSLVDY